VGRLASKEVTLGSLYDLQVGDVIPISLARADVLLEDSRLFTGRHRAQRQALFNLF
jgi:flagellar motor switch protein FliM